MLEVSEATPAAIGAELRATVAADPAARSSTTIRRIGQLDVQLVRRATSGRSTWLTWFPSRTPPATSGRRPSVRPASNGRRRRTGAAPGASGGSRNHDAAQNDRALCPHRHPAG